MDLHATFLMNVGKRNVRNVEYPVSRYHFYKQKIPTTFFGFEYPFGRNNPLLDISQQKPLPSNTISDGFGLIGSYYFPKHVSNVFMEVPLTAPLRYFKDLRPD